MDEPDQEKKECRKYEAQVEFFLFVHLVDKYNIPDILNSAQENSKIQKTPTIFLQA